jgi:DNA invertase Pin-like site-specific DNA recombinase
VICGCHLKSNHEGTAEPTAQTAREQLKGEPVRAAIYARVSTSNTSQDPAMQTRELTELCQRQGWEIAGEVEHVDRGVSGAKDSRPELNRMMADVRRRRFDAVY